MLSLVSSTHHHHHHHLHLQMEQISDGIYNHRQSPSSDRFLTVFSPPKPDHHGTCAVYLIGDELNEAEVFWTESNRRPISPSSADSSSTGKMHHSFRKPEKFGILAALPEEDCNLNPPLLCRKPSISYPSVHSTTPAAREYSQSAPARKFMQSAPVTVPMMQKKIRNTDFDEIDSIDDDDEDEILPPHEIVAKGSTKSSQTTFSVLEGAGRTLKGRDLRQVRNAVWRRTGFVD
ncbi:uncharacterized protein LOC124940187 [Impatiens glandulifera]|uniref:uncharacterized protein LOC124940187 n=1 Tax=Impatiens glandulifera TaxID=253017 RepID=UPI001FB056E7|nr:uncharacterized protein LOC124940187 [Impatiens glandulifera]